jgi:hypothetical protein
MDSLITKKFADGETEVLETERLIIRRFRANDWSDLYEYLSDPQVVNFEPYGLRRSSSAGSKQRRELNILLFTLCA